MRHAHFLIMGGFHLVEPPEENHSSKTNTPTTAPEITDAVVSSNLDAETGGTPLSLNSEPENGRVTILTLEILRELVQDERLGFRIPVTETEISDKSKGDALSKTIWLAQLGWFFIQFLLRLIANFEITQLELVTAALAIMNLFTQVYWWKKPLGVQVPIRVLLSRRLTDRERNAGVRSLRFSLSTTLSHTGIFL